MDTPNTFYRPTREDKYESDCARGTAEAGDSLARALKATLMITHRLAFNDIRAAYDELDPEVLDDLQATMDLSLEDMASDAIGLAQKAAVKRNLEADKYQDKIDTPKFEVVTAEKRLDAARIAQAAYNAAQKGGN
jgi:hypothetical protein